jgi:phenylacetate-CoA ligase
MSSQIRLATIETVQATVVCCTPTYALRLAEVATKEKVDLRGLRLKTIVVAGEPGGSIPAIRAQLESLWPGARIFDHHGMTEVGPVSHECPARPGVLHVSESAYFAEVIHPGNGEPAAPGQTGELILTTLGRTGSPLLRYRTGDLVRCDARGVTCKCGRSNLALEGGILDRADDMVIVRGVNIYPAAVDEIIRSCRDVAEYQVQVMAARTLSELSVTIEPAPGCADTVALVGRLAHAFNNAFGLRVHVTTAAPGSLPRFEMKAKRWVKS